MMAMKMESEGSQNNTAEDGDSEDEEGQCSASDEGGGRQGVIPRFVFTASRPKKPGSDRHGANDTNRHVSLEVEFASSVGRTNSAVPRLYIKRWLLGLCFFKDCPMMDVIFPWPSTLMAIVP
jgi:hypothetical protein